jgi:hypothetical protein
VNELVQNDDQASRSLWNQDFILSVEERFLHRADIANGSRVICFMDRTSVEVESQIPLVRFRAFYTWVRDWNVEKLE